MLAGWGTGGDHCEKAPWGAYVKAIVLCEGSDFDRLIWGDGAPPASDIGEAVLRSPKVGVNHRDIYLRRRLCDMVSIFLHVMSDGFRRLDIGRHPPTR